MPWISEQAEVLGTAFQQARLKSVGAIADSLAGDAVESLSVEHPSMGSAPARLVINEALNLSKKLKGGLEADRSGRYVALGRSLRHDGTDEVVRENMRSDFLAYELWIILPTHLPFSKDPSGRTFGANARTMPEPGIVNVATAIQTA